MAEQRKSTFTNGEINSYERNFTAMSYVFADGRGIISLSPIFDEFVGKDPKRGDNVYDYDSKMNFSIDAQGAIRLKAGVQNLLDNDELKMITIVFGNEKNGRTLSLYKPGTLKLSGKNYDNYVLRLTTKKDDEEEKMYHLMQRGSVAYKSTDNQESDDEMEVDLLLLIEFCNQLIANAFSTAYHGARRAGGSAPSGQRSGGKSRRNVEEEDGDGDSEEEGDSKPAGKPGSSGKKPAAKKNLNDEFADE